ncbi:unnamed protein product [Toxocara canis]|uniref:G_PROTEIN_RECEP_F1_2 domain-containing protein n=1 Tax=Toxocara canis TaxID=6265 RepID=A0A183V1V3_TOXCA|nr:unnamed protein product [Toxocara canis]
MTEEKVDFIVIITSSLRMTSFAEGSMHSFLNRIIAAHVVLLPTVLSVGMVNQCLNVITLSQIPSSGFTYLKASAIADILSIIALIPFIVRHAGLHDEHSHLAMLYHAHIELPLVNALMCAGALCIVAMTIDRYFSICHPIASFKSSDSRYSINGTIAILFALSFIVFVPSGISRWQKLTREVVNADNRTVWKMERNAEFNNTNMFRIYLMFREIMIWPIEIFRMSILLLITSTTFVICTLPASILSLFMDHFNHDSLPMQIFRAVANLLQATRYVLLS